MVLLQACCSSLQLSKAPADIGSAAACTAVYSSICSPVFQFLQVFWTDGHTATCMHMGGERRSYREQQSNLTSILPSNGFKGHIVYYIEDGVPQAQNARHLALVSSLLES